MASALPPGFRRRAFDGLPSTSGEAFAAARAEDPGRLWVTAGEQTAGRGRRGRPWTTGRGNLAASLLLIDPAPPELVPTISFVAAVALHRAVIDVAGPFDAARLSLKWPNDVLLDRRKIAGILVEGERLTDGRLAVVIGMGVNCVSHPEIGSGHAAGDLRSAGLTVEADIQFDALAHRMAGEIGAWDRGSGFAITRAAWLERAMGAGDAIRVNLTDRSIDGVFEALDEAGRLILRKSDGTREAFTAGDVQFAGAA